MRHKIFPHCFTLQRTTVSVHRVSLPKLCWTRLFITFISILLFYTGVSAHGGESQRTHSISESVPFAAQSGRKRIVTLRHNETTDGSRCVITSDTTLDDYSSYVEGERFIVRVPQAALAGAHSNQGGRGFADLRAEQSGDDVLVSFRLQAGATVHVNQTFNRLAIEFLTNERAIKSEHANRTSRRRSNHSQSLAAIPMHIRNIC